MNKNKCSVCQFNDNYVDGEVIYQGIPAEEGYYEWVNECKKGYTKKHKKGGVNCKGFKEIMMKCMGCGKEFPITQIKNGFCSEKCEKQYIQNIKSSVERDKERLIEVNKELFKLSKCTNKNKIIKMMELEYEKQALEHYIEEGEQILNCGV